MCRFLFWARVGLWMPFFVFFGGGPFGDLLGHLDMPWGSFFVLVSLEPLGTHSGSCGVLWDGSGFSFSQTSTSFSHFDFKSWSRARKNECSMFWDISQAA